MRSFSLPSQGDIVSCAGTYIHIWSINGNPVVSVNTFTGRSQQIVCCCVSEMNEWDTQNVIVTGHSDGVVRVSQLYEKHIRISTALVFLKLVQLSTIERHLNRLSFCSSNSRIQTDLGHCSQTWSTSVTQPLFFPSGSSVGTTKHLAAWHKQVAYTWFPCHLGIAGNTNVHVIVLGLPNDFLGKTGTVSFLPRIKQLENIWGLRSFIPSL